MAASSSRRGRRRSRVLVSTMSVVKATTTQDQRRWARIMALWVCFPVMRQSIMSSKDKPHGRKVVVDRCCAPLHPCYGAAALLFRLGREQQRVAFGAAGVGGAGRLGLGDVLGEHGDDADAAAM